MKKTKKVLGLLKKFLKKTPPPCQIYVFGGLALDGHHGGITRDHDDIDLICWRKDTETMQSIIEKMGYGVKTSPCPKNSEKICSFVSNDKRNLITFQIIEEMPNDMFEINFTHFPQQIYPIKLLGPINLTLEGIIFPGVTKKLLKIFNKNAGEYLNNLKANNSKLYNKLSYKLDNYYHDVELINNFYSK